MRMEHPGIVPVEPPTDPSHPEWEPPPGNVVELPEPGGPVEDGAPDPDPPEVDPDE